MVVKKLNILWKHKVVIVRSSGIPSHLQLFAIFRTIASGKLIDQMNCAMTPDTAPTERHYSSTI